MHVLLLLLLVQDTRQVREPAIPKSCTVLKARSSSVDEDKPDTARIQEAFDRCPAGQAVELTGKVFGGSAATTGGCDAARGSRDDALWVKDSARLRSVAGKLRHRGQERPRLQGADFRRSRGRSGRDG